MCHLILVFGHSPKTPGYDERKNNKAEQEDKKYEHAPAKTSSLDPDLPAHRFLIEKVETVHLFSADFLAELGDEI